MIRHTNKTIIFIICALTFIFKYSQAMPEALPEIAERPDIEYEAQDLKDPFEPPIEKIELIEELEEEVMPEAEPELPLPSLGVEGLVWGGSLPLAIINKKIVRIGDMIEGVQIIDINKEGIDISFDNRSHHLPSPWVVYSLKNPDNNQNIIIQEVGHEEK